MTISEVRDLVSEAFVENIPKKNDIENQISSADDKLAISRILSLLMRKFPPTSKLLIQSLGRSIITWRSGKSSYNDVSRALDGLYASLERKNKSYASSHPPAMPSERPSRVA